MKIEESGIFNAGQVSILKRQGIKVVTDLFFYFPRRYLDRSAPLDMRTSRVGDTVTFLGKVAAAEVKYGRRRRFSVNVHYQNLSIDVVFFQGIPFFSRALTPGLEVAFSGTLEKFRGRLTMTHPEIEILSGDEFIHTGKIIPLYKVTEGMRKNYLTSRTLREAVHKMLTKYSSGIRDHLSNEHLKKEKLMELQQALTFMHFPESFKDVENAKRRLAFDELLFFGVLMQHQKKERDKLTKSIVIKKAGLAWQKELEDTLPFKLTGDQVKAVATLRDLSMRPQPFAALLQGDVGSGKTLVALLASLLYMESGAQVALMAPTEILARQHFRNFINYLSHFPLASVELLLGGEKAKDRRAKLDRLQRGDTLMLIGTHSLIQQDVDFHDLAFVIIDEQHRFGVEQRKTLREKGNGETDMLAMTATPIPRSLTLTHYGDFETITLKEKPPGRVPVDTRLFEEKELAKLYMGVKKYVDQGRQAYIVYPVIDESDSHNWASLESDYENLESKVFKDYRLGLLHGRLSTDEKDRAMEKFKEGLIQVLVSTTVIEVGVDVANASVMMIRNAEKFGLSQLHQLRGRVGRGEHQSFCILVQSDKVSPEGRKRIEAMLESEDGFYLAQKDLEIRGPGEILGIKQAGVSEFKVADLRYHADLAVAANSLLVSHPALYEQIVTGKKWQSHFKNGLIFFEL